MERTTLVYIAGRIDEAHLVAKMLHDRDIPATIENEALQGAIGGLPAGESSSPRVRVPEEFAEKARQVVEAFEYQQRIGPPQVDDIIPEQHMDDEWAWDDWPTCGGCRRRRQTVCPVCHTAGVNFPIAEYGSPDPDHGHTPLLMCDTCDEAFEPEFYNVCAWCGHESPDGIDPPRQVEPERIPPRAMTVMWILAAVAAAVLGYFWWLTQ